MKPTRPRGFIALISAILISTILLSVAATLDQGVFFARFDGLNSEYQEIAQQLARACINTAMLKIRDDYDYTVPFDTGYDSLRGGVVIPLGTLYDMPVDCVLQAPTTTPAENNHLRLFGVQATAHFNRAFSTQRAVVTVYNPHYPQGMVPVISVSNWREVP